MTRITMKLRRTDTGQWACEFTLNGKPYQFVGSEPEDAVGEATEFLEDYGEIALLRIIEQPK